MNIIGDLNAKIDSTELDNDMRTYCEKDGLCERNKT